MANVAWSFSRLSAFETCPRRYYLTTVTKKVAEPQTAATTEGNAVHKALADYIETDTPLPQKWSGYAQYADQIKRSPGIKLIEHKAALDANLQPTTFFAKNVWMRAILDVGIVGTRTAIVLDWKTGKRKVDQSQLQLFSLTAFALHPYLERVDTGFIWLKDRMIDKESYHKDDTPALWREFMIRVRRMEAAHDKDKFPANPSGLCGWCPVGQTNCEFWKGNQGAGR